MKKKQYKNKERLEITSLFLCITSLQTQKWK